MLGTGCPDASSTFTAIAPLDEEYAPTGGECVVLEGVGHIPLAREPVRVNLLIREFAESLRLAQKPSAADAHP